MSEKDAEKIFDEKRKASTNIDNLSENELSTIFGGGDTIIINNNVSSSSCCERRTKRRSSRSESMTALGGTIVGSTFALIGLILAGFSIYKWKNQGPDSKL